jgi:hypothetical protein
LHNGTRQRNFINPENLHANLSGHFNMNEDIIRKAFEILEKKNGSANAINYL